MEELRSVTEAVNLAAQTQVDVSAAPGTQHKLRSQRFVDLLAGFLRNVGEGNDLIRVLHRGSRRHRGEFGLNELLHDILVCEVSASKPRYITRVLWQIESEFSRSRAQTMKDFNKLILGSAECKLFVGPRTSNDEDLLQALHGPSLRCTGKVFVALVPHPSEWPLNVESRLWQSTEHGWSQLTFEREASSLSFNRTPDGAA